MFEDKAAERHHDGSGENCSDTCSRQRSWWAAQATEDTLPFSSGKERKTSTEKNVFMFLLSTINCGSWWKSVKRQQRKRRECSQTRKEGSSETSSPWWLCWDYVAQQTSILGPKRVWKKPWGEKGKKKNKHDSYPQNKRLWSLLLPAASHFIPAKNTFLWADYCESLPIVRVGLNRAGFALSHSLSLPPSLSLSLPFPFSLSLSSHPPLSLFFSLSSHRTLFNLWTNPTSSHSRGLKQPFVMNERCPLGSNRLLLHM